MPKSEVDIYFVSGYQSSEFGLGPGSKLTPISLKNVQDKTKNMLVPKM